MKRFVAIITHRPALDTSDWLFLAVLVAANVVPWGLFIWGLAQ